jgi:hypothetical protein
MAYLRLSDFLLTTGIPKKGLRQFIATKPSEDTVEFLFLVKPSSQKVRALGVKRTWLSTGKSRSDKSDKGWLP